MATIVRTGGGGADLSVVTAAAADVLASKVIVDANGNQLTGTIASKAAATITPGTADQTIAAGQYLSGAQTINGDADLIAGNIASGKDIFGVAGSAVVPNHYEIGDVQATANKTTSPYTLTFTITLANDPIMLAYSKMNGTTVPWAGYIDFIHNQTYCVGANSGTGAVGALTYNYNTSTKVLTVTHSYTEFNSYVSTGQAHWMCLEK